MAELEYFAPAKVNLSLRVHPPGRNGYHPLRSLIQTLEWGDTLAADAADDDELVIEGAELPDDESNLVWKALETLGGSRRPLRMVLTKRTPVAAGMGGGSSDAAAALRLGQEIARVPDSKVVESAREVGADVTFFLTGGTAWMEGYGELITPIEHLAGFAVAVVVPPFELSTRDVYRRWDDLGFPEGEAIPQRALPPVLRGYGELGNDLMAAALDLRPELGDWMVDLAGRWGTPVALSGSGPSVFAYFADIDEAESAAAEASADSRARFAAPLRRRGVERLA